MVDSLRFAARVTASGYALRANAHQHEKPTTVRFSLVHCMSGSIRLHSARFAISATKKIIGAYDTDAAQRRPMVFLQFR
ncbi:hypothetical protein [Caballeronia sp. LZ043]|uniref:hypothetical protein n=1 Tax=Caballeronia sp. LZ043 TaxID=3038569 RepID=UPI00286432C7|nr:hypothetical protein [Caballeronia sp. LZ043]MDR5822491.1 hypothetical protein [Caballeronia sp. LZ043]